MVGAGSNELLEAAAKLSSSSSPAKSEFEEFLQDINPFVESYPDSRIPSSKLVEYVLSLEDRPYRFKKFTAYDLASLLKPHGIHSIQMRPEGRNVRGYEKAELLGLISKYLPEG